MCSVMDWLYVTPPIEAVCDYDGDGQITSADFTRIANILRDVSTNTKIVSGVLKIDAENPKDCISISTNGVKSVSLGAEGVNATVVNTENIMCCYQQGITQSTFAGVIINGHTGQIKCVKNGDYNNGVTIQPYQITVEKDGSLGRTIITENEIQCPLFTPTSLEEKKKNFEKLQSGLDIIKDIDIYKYNMKDEEDDTKKHIGFVIGDKYKYNKEITSKNNDGADLYSFVSVCCKAIQEQQEEIQELKARIEKLEKGE